MNVIFNHLVFFLPKGTLYTIQEMSIDTRRCKLMVIMFTSMFRATIVWVLSMCHGSEKI